MKKFKQLREDVVSGKKEKGKELGTAKKEKITINPNLRVLRGLRDKVRRS